jgi:hypothetical protein
MSAFEWVWAVVWGEEEKRDMKREKKRGGDENETGLGIGDCVCGFWVVYGAVEGVSGDGAKEASEATCAVDELE